MLKLSVVSGFSSDASVSSISLTVVQHSGGGGGGGGVVGGGRGALKTEPYAKTEGAENMHIRSAIEFLLGKSSSSDQVCPRFQIYQQAAASPLLLLPGRPRALSLSPSSAFSKPAQCTCLTNRSSSSGNRSAGRCESQEFELLPVSINLFLCVCLMLLYLLECFHRRQC